MTTNNLAEFRSALSADIKDAPKLQPAKSLHEALLDVDERLKEEVKEILKRPLSEINNEQRQRMSDILKYLLQQFMQTDRDRRSENTWLALENNWAQFEKWCTEHNHIPLPATPTVFIEFLNAVAADTKPSTLSMYRWAISIVHLCVSLPDPTAAFKSKSRMESIRRRKVIQGKAVPRQASPFRLEHLMIVQEMWGESDNLRERRDVALLTLAYESMLRESELARVKVSDLYLDGDGSAILFVPFTKADKSGDGQVKALCDNTYQYLQRYFAIAGLEGDTLAFTGINEKSNRPIAQANPLHGKTIDRIFARAHELIKDKITVPVKVWSGHSARRGGAMDLLAAGYSLAQIQQAGGWKSPIMVLRYGKDIMANESAMAKMMAKQG